MNLGAIFVESTEYILTQSLLLSLPFYQALPSIPAQVPFIMAGKAREVK